MHWHVTKRQHWGVFIHWGSKLRISPNTVRVGTRIRTCITFQDYRLPRACVLLVGIHQEHVRMHPVHRR